jgi:hypothetical protein
VKLKSTQLSELWAPRRKIRQIARGGGTFRASKLSALGSLICVYGETEQPLAQQHIELHDVGCALESFQFCSFKRHKEIEIISSHCFVLSSQFKLV